MTVEKKMNEEELRVLVSGRIDTTTAKDFESEVMGSLEGVKNLILDFENVEYISSAGLRVLLLMIKQMNKQGSMIIKNSNDMIKEIFEVTGFQDLVKVE